MAKAKGKATAAIAKQQEQESLKKKKAAQKKQVSESEVRAGGRVPTPPPLRCRAAMHALRRPAASVGLRLQHPQLE